jgi:hypothetical protein
MRRGEIAVEFGDKTSLIPKLGYSQINTFGSAPSTRRSNV